MSDTLGSLIDKLAIVDLKLWHVQEKLKDEATPEADSLRGKNVSLLVQRRRLIKEIDEMFEVLKKNPETVNVVSPSNKLYA